VLLLDIVVISYVYGTANATSPIPEKGTQMRGSHVHLGVKDLPAALQWLDKVWQLRPTFQNERMATLPFGDLTIILPPALVAGAGASRRRDRASASRRHSRGAHEIWRARARDDAVPAMGAARSQERGREAVRGGSSEAVRSLADSRGISQVTGVEKGETQSSMR